MNHHEIIWNITNLLHSSHNLQETLDVAITQIMQAVNAESGTLWLTDENQAFIHPFIARGPKVDNLKDLKLKLGEGMAGWVIQNKTSQIVADARLDPRWASRFDTSTGYVTKSLLCVPLATPYSNIGCLQLINKQDGSLFSPEDLALCEQLASIISIAIEKKGLLIKEKAAQDILIRLDKVSKTYIMGEVKVEALKEVSAEIYKGELLVILGTSGSGKSTMLNLLGGMDKPTSGQIINNNKNLALAGDRELTLYRRHEVGFVFQFYNLIPDLTTAENVALAAELARNPMKVKDVIEDVGLSHRINNFPSQLSGGEQQRVSIARAIVKKPRILLCDEPTGALDYNTGKQVLGILANVTRKSDGTVIIVTHNSAIGAIADRVLKMRSGQIVEIARNPHPISAERIEW